MTALDCLVEEIPTARRSGNARSEQARRVTILNANWSAGPDGDDGRFQIQMITDEDERYVVSPSPAAIAALVAFAKAHTVLVWDPEDRTLIAANVVGSMPWTEGRAAPGS